METFLYVLGGFGLLLYIVGIILGGLRDERNDPAARPPPAHPFLATIRSFFDAFDGIGDKLRSAGAAIVFLVCLFLAGMAAWDGGWTFAKLPWLVTFTAGAIYFGFNLYATHAEKKKRMFRITTALTIGLVSLALALFLITSVFKNNRAWYEVRIQTKDVVVEDVTETVRYVKTPNLKFVDATHWDDNPCASNPDLTGYEFKCDGGKVLMRAQAAKLKSINAAGGEYDTLEEMVLAHKAKAIELKRVRKEQIAEMASLDGKPATAPTSGFNYRRLLWIVPLALIFLVLLIAALREIFPKKEGGSAQPPAPAPNPHPAPAAAAPAGGAHHP